MDQYPKIGKYLCEDNKGQDVESCEEDKCADVWG